MDSKLLKLLLNYKFYLDNKSKLSASLFEDEIKELFEVVETAHDKYQHDITSDELLELWKKENPVATDRQISLIASIIDDIEDEDTYSEDVATDLITAFWQRRVGKQIGELGIAVAEGDLNAFDKIKQVIQHSESGFTPDTFDPEVTKDIEQLLHIALSLEGWQFNIKALDRVVGKLGPNQFHVVFARPNAGKSAFCVSTACGPQGFCEQGARVLILGNEEDPARTMLRAYSAHSGMTSREISLNPKEAKRRFQPIFNNIDMMNVQGWSLKEVENYIHNKSPDIVYLDQLDKVQGIRTKTERLDVTIKDLYTDAREMANRQNITLFGLSQASADAESKTKLFPVMMENSKTGKFAEADVIYGIGKYPNDANGEFDPTRFITIGKNKLTGIHETITCRLDNELSRYDD